MVQVNSVGIVGGGSAGWLTALFLQKTYNQLDITVVEDPDVPPIITGESCTIPFVEMLEYLGIDFTQWIQEADAFPKLGGEFLNWRCEGSRFIQPLFSYYTNKFNLENPEFSENYILAKGALALDFPISKLSIAGHLIDNNKIHINNNSMLLKSMYHFDSRKNADFLKQEGIRRGIKVLHTKVLDASLNPDGLIHSLITNTEPLTYDFYFDCTGFRQLLVKKIGNRFTDFTDRIFTNSVLAWWDESEKLPFTQMSAYDYGWRFNISLSSRSGNGYIYNNNYITKDQAKEEIERRIGKSITPIASLTWKPECLLTPWKGNTLAIGLSAGFLEPLGSPGHTLISLQLRLLNDFFNHSITDKNARSYNTRYEALINDTAKFINLHYLGKKSNTKFWIDRIHDSNEFLEDLMVSAIDYKKIEAYSFENYAVVIQGIGLSPKEDLLTYLKFKNPRLINIVQDELIRLNTFFEELTVGCENINFWKKLWLKQ